MSAAAPFLPLSGAPRPLSRRGLVLGAGVAAGTALARPARAVTAMVMPAAAASRYFSVLYKGAKIGSHSIVHSAATGATTVSTEIHMLVKAAFLTLFAFSHRSTETWRGGRLVSLAGETVEHGATLRVDGTATPAGFRVMSKDGPFIAPATTLTSNSLWTPAVLEQATVVDAQHGGVIGISSRRLADEPIVVGGRTVKASSHSLITPYLAGTIWYDEQDLWVHGAFEHDGSRIQYQLIT
ncbi:MAG: DUF6134 family protein [Reyranella sp.]